MLPFTSMVKTRTVKLLKICKCKFSALCKTLTTTNVTLTPSQEAQLPLRAMQTEVTANMNASRGQNSALMILLYTAAFQVRRLVIHWNLLPLLCSQHTDSMTRLVDALMLMTKCSHQNIVRAKTLKNLYAVRLTTINVLVKQTTWISTSIHLVQIAYLTPLMMVQELMITVHQSIRTTNFIVGVNWTNASHSVENH